MKSKRLLLYLLPVFLVVLAGSVLYLSKTNFLNYGRMSGCGCSDYKKATGSFEAGEEQAFFNGERITSLSAALSEDGEQVMGASDGENKWIEIDLSEQKLTAWESGQIFLRSAVSAGKWYPTPTGEFRIWLKLKYTKMSGGKPGTGSYYYLPNVPYTMYFNKGFGLHGTYWHNNFGHPMSHGCVNLPTPVAEKLFYWVTPTLPPQKNSTMASKDNPGTRVVVHQ